MRACVALVERGVPDSAATVGRTAEALFRKRIARSARDVEALVGLGRTLSQCLLPSANFISQGSLSQDAMGYLEDALDLEPTNWTARFVLASIAYRSPAFLGRGDIAARHFEELLRQQGNRALDPTYARVFELRGMQLMRAGKADSARALWTRGLSLFPADTALAALIARNAGTASGPPAELPMMRIVARPEPEAIEAPLPAVRAISSGEVLTTAGGAADVFQAVQVQPGATLVQEGSNVYTRGGDASETATILNGSRMLSLNRFEGLNGSMFGAIEPFVVKSIRYSTGGFSAMHGNALSGIIDIETDGRPRERKTRAGLSLVQASGTAWIPANRKTGGWVSARVSQTGALLATHGRSDEFDGSPHSEEIIGSIVTTPTPESEVRATALIASDASRRIVSAAGWRGPFQSTGDARALMVASRWKAMRAPFTLRGNVAAASRSTDFRFGILERDRTERSLSGRVDAEYEAGMMTLRGGVTEGAQDRLDRGVAPTSPSVASGAPSRPLDAESSSTRERGGYVEAQLVRGGSTIIAGTRADRLPGESTTTFDPRVSLMHRRGDWTMRVSGGEFHQGRWRAESAIPNAGAPSGIPGSARHLVLGLERQHAGTTLRAEAFRKHYSDYRAQNDGPAVASTDVHGMDIIAESRTSGPVTGWVSYSLLDAESQLVDRRVVRSPFDVTHSAAASFTATIADWSLGMTGRYGTGAPYTPAIGATADANGFPRPVYGFVTSQRLPNYGRLDMRVMRHIQLPKVLVTSFAEMINITNRRNVSGVTYDASYRNREFTHAFFASRTIVLGGEVLFR